MRALPSVTVLLVCLAGCASSPASPDAAARDASPADSLRPADVIDASAATDVAADLTSVGPDLPPAEDVQCAPDGANACVHEARGRVTDTDGNPLANKVVTMCGRVCFSDRTLADGTFRIAVEDRLDLTNYTVSVHGRPEYATTFVPVPPLTDGAVVFTQAITVPRLSVEGPDMPDPMAGGEVTAGDVTLIVPPGGSFEYDLEDVVLDALGRRFRYGTTAPSAYPRYAPGAVGVLYGFGPFNLTSTRPIGVRVQNRTTLAPGSAVSFVPMGAEIVDPPITAGRALAGVPGHVSMDGRTIATDPGVGLTLLTWLAIVARM